MEFFSRRHLLSPLLLALVYFTYVAYAKSHHIRHHRDRFKRQQGAHLYLPGSYVTDGDDEPDAGPWLEWSSPSQCSRTCGGGVSTQYRQCMPGHRCSGPTRRHFSCNTQDCPDLADFRAIQCSEFNNVPFEGALYEWVPYTKSPQACELNCMPKGERFYYRHKLQVTDGTKCNDETLDVCVEGKCQPVGCDMMLGSDAREDQCRVCEGDGSMCNTMSGLLDMQDLQVGYNDVLLIPSGAVNINVREVDRSNNYLAIRNASGHYYLNGNWRIDFPRTLDFAGSKFHYERSPQGFSAPDTITSLGPIEESIFVVLLYQDRNVGVHYEYSLPKTIQRPTDTETYAWTFDQFTPCTASCGGGYQSRNVSCAGRKSLDPVDSNLCDANNKPAETQRCGEIPCEPKWVAKEWGKCSATCGMGGTQDRKIYCEQVISSGVPSIVDDGQCSDMQKPLSQQSCNEGVVCGEWHIGPWKPCNRLCGKGKEIRKVTCYRKVDGKISILHERECSHAEKPESSKSCLLRPCEGVDWVASEWSGCENKCGLSEETRIVQCMTAAGQVFPENLCAQDEERPETKRKCETKASGCDYEWHASQWSECSAKCGTGVQTRIVLCTRIADDCFKKVEDSNCDPSKKYDSVRNCTAEETECPGEWFTGPWTKCSKNCGGGVKSRKVLCVRGNATVRITECDEDLIPSSSEECNKQACDKDEVMPVVTGETIEVTEPTIEIDEDYEIVEDDKCEGGEWVDAASIPQRKLGPREKLLSVVSNTLGDSTDIDSKPLGDSPFIQDELMQSDPTYIGDDDSGKAIPEEPGSGDDDIGFGTGSPDWMSSFGSTVEGSGGFFSTPEGSGEDTEPTGFTEITETPFIKSTAYILGSSVSTDSSSTETSESIEEIDISSEAVSEETDTTPTESDESLPTELTTEETIYTETDEDVSKMDVTGTTEEVLTKETDEVVSELDISEGTTEEPLSKQTDEEITEKFSESPVTAVTEPTSESISAASSESVTEAATEAITEESDTVITEEPEKEISTDTSKESITDTSQEPSEEPLTQVTQLVTEISGIATKEPATDVTDEIFETTTPEEKETVTDASVEISSQSPKEIITEEEIDVSTGQISTESEKLITETELPEVLIPLASTTVAPEVTTEEEKIDVTSEKETLVTSTVGIEARIGVKLKETTTEEVETTTETITREAEGKEATTEKIEGTTEITSKVKETTKEFERVTEDEVTEPTTVEIDIISSVTEKSTKEVSLPSTSKVSVSEFPIKTTETVIGTEKVTGPELTTMELTTTKAIKVSDLVTEKVTISEASPEPATETTAAITTTAKPTTIISLETTTEPLISIKPEEIITSTEEYEISTKPAFIKPAVFTAKDVTTHVEELITVSSMPEVTTIEGSTEEVEQVTQTTEEPKEISTIIPETVTQTTTEYDIWSSTEKVPPSTETSSIIEIFTTAKTKWCKKPRKPSCRRSEFGCCPDKITPAKGPFDKGCPIPETCEETKYGCCEDNVSPAAGENYEGCPESQCDQTLFGCCPDNKTPSQGNNNEGCPPPPPECLKSEFGCCDDNSTEAEGPNGEGCEEEKAEYTTGTEEEISSTTVIYTTTTEGIDCRETAYGCCPDGVSVALGEFFKGCDIIDEQDCNKSFYKCCPDGVTSAIGPNYQGCITECSKSTFGCCEDGITPAHGYSKEGCCSSSRYGCCPDNIKPAEGPNQQGCGCIHSAFRCCPDNVTFAQGSNKEGCGCQYTEHGCCPDNHSPAGGPDFANCSCHTFQFGCCPDGVTVAKGSRNQGCGCQYTEFGCCTDQSTPASGPNYSGCDCASSKYGCCPDGENEAQGEDFDGCQDIPENLQANCQLTKDRGACRNYTVKWFYDMEYGGCSRFWYGGCDGNGNRFKTKEECNNICVEPTGPDRCNLPKVIGPCEGYYPQWYYDKTNNHCTQFIYGGCLGNNNRFETRDECNELCVSDRISDACEQPKQEGPCHGNYVNWFYNKESGYCEQFVYGGCRGNNNNFPTEASCKQKCARVGQKKPSCSLPQVQGNCTERLARWYYDSTEKRCMPFYYTGCGDNKNNFISQYHCEIDCPKEIVLEACQLPADSGECSNYVSRYYYDTRDRACKHFYYGGCGGNKNNFVTEDTCQTYCVQGIVEAGGRLTSTLPTSTFAPEPFPTESCNLPPEVGPCRGKIPRWYYNNDGTCHQFSYGGCGGNKNNFGSSDECYQMCGNVEDVCTLPMVVGSCNAEYVSWFYNQTTDTCEMFKYGGCMGNGNKFDDLESCEKRCKKAPVTPTAPTEEICHLPSESGPCRAHMPRWYYNKHGKCKEFIYGGCGANKNNFMSEESCYRVCGYVKGFCHMPPETGPCRARLQRWYHTKNGVCEEFIYGGCGGNKNNFASSEECYQTCEETKTPTTSSPDELNRICYQPLEPGNCNETIFSFFFNPSKHKCTSFTYSGCGGNDNRFASEETCERTCGIYRNQDICSLPYDSGLCRAHFNKFYYDKNSKTCKEFVYGGCDGNGNRFESIEECKHYCQAEEPTILTTAGPLVSDICSLPSDMGPCGADMVRFHYDKDTNTCKEFVYGGCQGNENRFYTIEECEKSCKVEEEKEHKVAATTEPLSPTAVAPLEPHVQTPEPEPEQPEICAQYKEECRSLRCQYGMKGYVENLCNRCECVDPCEDVACPDETRCEVELNRNNGGSSEVANFIGVCRQINKPGDCPYVHDSGDDCREDCRDDADCVIDLKCCSTSCGRVCSMPTTSTLAPPSELRTTEGYVTQRPPARGTYAPEVIEEEFNPVVTAGEGDYATLRCAVRGNPRPVFSWRKGNTLIDGKEPRYRILLEGAALQIISLYKTDAGIYLCSADNNIGKALHKEIRLDVIVTVRANITLATTNFPIGSDISIPCDVEGYPIPTVQWYKDGKPLQTSHAIQVTESHRLNIKNATERDSGEYRCAAWNEYTNATSTVPLLIQGRFIHPSCKDNPFFANCQLIIKANFCSHKYYARFCCRSCTEAGMLPSVGPHLRSDTVQNDIA